MTDKEFLKRLGNRIREKREEAGLTQIVFGKKTGITRMHVYRIEEGKHSTSITILKKISEVFNIRLEELVKIG